MQVRSALRGRGARRRLPGPSGLPVVGRQLDFMRHPVRLLEQLHRDHGDLVAVPLLARTVVGVFGAENVRKVRRAYGEEVDITSSAGWDLYLLRHNVQGRGPLNVKDGADHTRYREICRRAITATMPSHATIVSEQTRRMLDAWGEGREIDLVPEMNRLSDRIFKIYMFGIDVEQEEPAANAAVDLYIHLMTSGRRFLGASMIGRDIPGISRGGSLLRQMKELDGFVGRILDGSRPTTHPSLAHAMAEAIEEIDGRPDVKLVRELMNQMYYAGVWSVPANLMWTFVLLAQHPEPARRLLDELQETLGGEAPKVRTRLPYLDALLMESIRLYSGVYDFRRTTEPIELDGHDIPGGTTILLAPWLSQRSPRHFDDPLTFRPERFLDPDLRHPDGAFDPWGFGSLMCLGRNIGRQAMRIITSEVVQWVRLDLVPGQHIEPVAVPFGVATNPTPGARMRVERQDGDTARSAAPVSGSIVGAVTGAPTGAVTGTGAAAG